MGATAVKSSMYERLESRKQNKRNAIANERVFDIANARRVEKPIAVIGLGAPKHVTITPKDYKKLDVDADNYQRGETSIINSIIASLQAGGTVIAPPLLSKRKWQEDGKLWIVDGLQRCTALMSLDRSFEALVFEVDSLDQERAMFLAANEKLAVSPNRSIKAHPGATALLLRTVDADQHHPCYCRISWGTGAPEKISAAIAISGLVPVSGAGVSGGRVMKMLARTDAAIARDEKNKRRCALFMRMVGLTFPKGYVKRIAMEALGVVAYDRWFDKANPEIPPISILSRISRINYDNLVPSSSSRFRPIVIEAVKKIWKD